MALGDVVRATIDRIEGHTAVLLFDEIELNGTDPQSLLVPLRHLPKAVKEGDVLVVEFLQDEEAMKQRDVVARKLLEDILNGK